MSLEAQLEANTKAINRLADLLERANITMPTAEPKAGDWIPQEERAEAPTAEPTASAPTEIEQEASNDDDAEAATPPTTDEPVEAPSEQPTADAPTTDKLVDANQVIDAMKACLVRTKDRKVIVNILDKYGVKRVSDLDSRDLASAKADFEGA